MTAKATAQGRPAGPARPYRALWGYRRSHVVARYHRRRYQRPAGKLRAFFVTRAVGRALRLAGVRRGWILDIPCGSGVAIRALSAPERRPVGADVSLAMLRYARGLRANGPDTPWVCADIEGLPFRDRAFAAVVCLRFFAHLPLDRWPAVLQALVRLTPGPIVIGLPMRRSSKHWWRAFKRQLGRPAKLRPIFRKRVVTAILDTMELQLRHRIWQSPFTDTALIVVQPGRSGPVQEQLGVARMTEDGAPQGLGQEVEPIRVWEGVRGRRGRPRPRPPAPRA